MQHAPTLDCLNGYFVARLIDCVGESLMKAPDGGGGRQLCLFRPDGPEGQHEMGQRLFQSLYGGQSIALGDATRWQKPPLLTRRPPPWDPLRRFQR